MNTGYGFGRCNERDARRRSDRMRFLGLAIALWTLCAAAIYLIGPSEPEHGPAEPEAIGGVAQRPGSSLVAYEQ